MIKKKSAIANSVPEQLKEGIQSAEDDSSCKPIGKDDQTDSKNMDSSRSTEEDDDEDYEEAQRTAAINQEVKHIVTEVLSKVTDEIFDEIAARVFSENALTTNGMSSLDSNSPNHQVVPPPPPVPAPMSFAKVPVKAKEFEAENASGESSSGSPGNVLSLVNYASSDNVENENHTSSIPKSESSAGQSGHPCSEAEKRRKSLVYAEGDHIHGNSRGVQQENVALDYNLNDHMMNSKDTDKGGVWQPYSSLAAEKQLVVGQMFVLRDMI